MNHREVLGVTSNADAGDIKRAFRQAAKELHPDHSDSPEAAEAFARIKEAHDALLKEVGPSRESTTVQAAAAYATAATATQTTTQTTTDDSRDAEAVKAAQELDDAVLATAKRSFFKRAKESDVVKKHRKKLKTNERRLRGLY